MFGVQDRCSFYPGRNYPLNDESSQARDSRRKSAPSSASNLANDKSQAVDKILGYGVDKEGFFTSDFNEAGNLPKDVRIHSSTIGYINEIMVERSPYFSSVDYPRTIHNAYKMVSQILDLSHMGEKTSFSSGDLERLPEAFSFDESMREVNKVFSFDEYRDATARDIAGGYTLKQTFFSPDSSVENPNPYNRDTLKNNKYLNKDASLTIGGLVSAFVKDNLGDVIEGETTVFGKLSGADKNVDSKEFSQALTTMSLTYTGSIGIPADLGIWRAKDLNEAREMFIEWGKKDNLDSSNIIEITQKQVEDFLKNLGAKKKLNIRV